MSIQTHRQYRPEHRSFNSSYNSSFDTRYPLTPLHGHATVEAFSLNVASRVNDLSNPRPLSLQAAKPSRIPSPVTAHHNFVFGVSINIQSGKVDCKYLKVLQVYGIMMDNKKNSPATTPGVSALSRPIDSPAEESRNISEVDVSCCEEVASPNPIEKLTCGRSDKVSGYFDFMGSTPPPSTRPGHNLRFVSTPILPSQRALHQDRKFQTDTAHDPNNAQIMQTKHANRLLRAISPCPQPMQRSKTMGIMSGLTSSISRASLGTIRSRNSSGCSARAADIKQSIVSTKPLPSFTTNKRQVSTAQPNSYWCGRFQALSDRFFTESMEEAFQDPRFVKKASLGSEYPSPEKYVGKPNFTISGRVKLTKEPEDSVAALHDATGRLLLDEHDRRCKRVFTHLDALCLTAEAKKSLWEWQLVFARKEKKEKLLPKGGKMIAGGWVSRMGRALTVESSLGRRTGLGLGQKKGSVLGLVNDYSKKGVKV